MAVRFPNPPLTEVRAEHLLTLQQAADHFQVEPITIKLWIHRGKVEPLPLGPGGPQLFHIGPLARAEQDAWNNGANRAIRGGRKPGWKPCQQATAA